MSNALLIFLFFVWSTTLNLIAGQLVFRSKKLFLFPTFECFMVLSFMMLWQTSPYFIPHFVLFSALAITISTDLSCMLISRFVSLYLAPTGLLFSFLNMSPISWQESLAASIMGYFFFYLINKIFYLIKKQDGLGQGDFDLMALIGAYTGLLGIWFTILIGSIFGTICALIFMILRKSTLNYVPFGPFLAIATMSWLIYQSQIIVLLFD